MPEVIIRKTEIADFIRNGVSVIRRRGLAWDDSRLWHTSGSRYFESSRGCPAPVLVILRRVTPTSAHWALIGGEPLSRLPCSPVTISQLIRSEVYLSCHLNTAKSKAPTVREPQS